MQVKFNGELSEFLALIGGGPQGTLLGQIEYLVQSNDNADIAEINWEAKKKNRQITENDLKRDATLKLVNSQPDLLKAFLQSFKKTHWNISPDS